MTGESVDIFLSDLGRNRRQALRRLLTEFRHRGWKDSGDTALTIITTVAEANRGLPARRLADSAPSEFFVQNRLRRADLERVLREVAGV